MTYKLSFYYIWHFSNFIKPSAKRIATTIYTDEIEQVAFLNPDGSIVAVILNRKDSVKNLSLRLEGQLIDVEIPKESISTIVIHQI